MDANQIARQTVADHLECSPQLLVAEDKTRLYPWVNAHQMIWVVDRQRVARLCVVTGGGQGLLLRAPDDLPRLGQLFGDEGVELPGGLAPAELARCLRDLLRGPGGMVGEAAALARERPSLDAWLWPDGDRQSDQVLWERHLADPVLGRTGDHWRLAFSYFTRLGGVERWTVAGGAGGVTAVEVEQAAPAKRFRWPYV